MSDPLRVAVVGVGRIGHFHALHVQELAAARGDCRLVAVVDRHHPDDGEVVAALRSRQSHPLEAFGSVEALVRSGVADAAIVATRTNRHRADTEALVAAGIRVLLEKPLADALDESEALGAWLDADEVRSRAVMLAFQRRFDPAMLAAERLLRSGAIGELFKLVSVLEDPGPPPPEYESAGLLVDMGVHNADEILWLSRATPESIAAHGARVHNQTLPEAPPEAHDDAFVQMWLDSGAIAQLQVSRNHVAGYRNECVLFGREGRIHVGHFEGDPLSVRLEAYGRHHALLDRRRVGLRDYGPDVPPFIRRFGPAYRAEVDDFITRNLRGEPFTVTHREGLAAMRLIAAADRAMQRGTRVDLAG